MYFRCVCISILIVAVGGTSPLFGQWNVIAGYDISHVSDVRVNRLISSFNEIHPERTLTLKPARILHGFMAGFRYGYDLGGLELYYSKRATRRIGDDYDILYENRKYDPDMEGSEQFLIEASDLDLFYDIKTITFLKEFGKTIRFGASLDYNIYTHEINYIHDKIRDFKVNQDIWGSKVFMGVHLTNSTRMSFSVRMYYQWIWDQVDLAPLESVLFPMQDSCTECREQPHTIGLSIIINNGLQ